MSRWPVVFAIVALLAAPSQAAGLRSALEEANRLLEEGQTEAAMQLYTELQVEDPTSGAIQYNLGCAHAELARELAMSDPEAAQEHFDAAQRAFSGSAEASSGMLETNAAYNLANTKAQHAKMLLQYGAHEDALTTMRQSITEYENLLAYNPDHKAGQINLDHMRYLYKTLKQQPPPEPEPDQQDEDEEEEGEEERGEEDTPEDGEDEQRDQEQEPDPTQPEDEDSDTDPAQQPEDGDEDDGEPEPRQPDMSEPEAPERQETIEAILQALEDLDNEEQQRMVQGDEVLGGATEWW